MKIRGEMPYNLDAKGRLTFPAKLKEIVGEQFVVAKGLDGCLFVYPTKEWEQFEAKIAALPLAKSRKMERFFCASATVCEPDAQSRITIAPQLREYAGIQKEAVIIVLSGRVEIWDAARWKQYNDDVSSDNVADIMEEMSI